VATESLPTSANQEDHVSMAAYAARRLHAMTRNLARILAIELICAAQGIELRRPLHSSPPLEAALATIRKVSPFLAEDRPLGGEIEALAGLIEGGGLGATSGPRGGVP
jgi:histidine ammonia-lyase